MSKRGKISPLNVFALLVDTSPSKQVTAENVMCSDVLVMEDVMVEGYEEAADRFHPLMTTVHSFSFCLNQSHCGLDRHLTITLLRQQQPRQSQPDIPFSRDQSNGGDVIESDIGD